MSVAQAVADVAGVAGVVPVSALEPAGAYAVVRVWSAPAGHRPDAPVDYVSDGTNWYVLGCEDGYSWEQVTRHAVRVEVVREGVAAHEAYALVAEVRMLRGALAVSLRHIEELSAELVERGGPPIGLAAERMGP